ncbi:MAG: peptidoglycan-binding protein [Hyphomicrobiales bacterium]
MKPGIPWSVKGIGDDAREAAKLAARRSGLTLGEWLNSVILDQAEAEDHRTPHLPPPLQRPAALPPREDFQSKLDEIATQLQRLAAREQDTAHFAEPAPEPEADREIIKAIIDRLDEDERKTAQALEAVHAHLCALNQQLADLPRFGFPERPEDVPGYPALEGALRNIVEHIETSERKSQEALKAVQNRLAGAGRSSEVQRRLDELLARRSRAEVASRSELREVESRLQAALKEAQSSIRAANPAGEIQRLKADIGSINQRIDDVKADAASERDVHALKAAIEQLSARVAQGPDLRPLADMDRRLADVARRIEQSQGQARLEPQIAALERRVQELDQRLAAGMRAREETSASGSVGRHLAAFSERLAEREQQLSHIAALDQSIHQLFESLEQNREASHEIAEHATSRIADRLIKAYPQSSETPDTASRPSPELVALGQGLDAVRASVTAADHRTQATLQAVHDTLEQIINKIAELESASVAGHRAHASQEPAATLNPEAVQSEPAIPDESPHIEHNALEPSAEPPLDAAQTSPEPNIHLPSEPVHLGGDFKPDDFIAAARRAARAAARQSVAPSGAGAGILGREKPESVSKPFSLSLPFFKKMAPKPADIAADKDGKRRRLLLAGLVLLAAVSAYVFTTLGRPASEATPASRDSVLTVPKKAPARATGPTPGAQPLLSNTDFNPKRDAPVPSAPLRDQDQALQAVGPEALRKAAQNGDPAAEFIVASRYLNGKSVAQDHAAAARWFQRAAAKGLAPAQYRLGTLFERGKGVPQNMALARMWYERAAEHGNVKAMHNAAVIYAGSQAGAPDYEKALRWFTAAGEHGLNNSQFNLAVLYERGLGAKRDAANAFYWYSLAAKHDDPDAALRAGALERLLAPSTVADVRQRVEGFKPKEDQSEANVVALKNPSWDDSTPSSAVEALRYEMPVLGAAVEISDLSSNEVSEAQKMLNKLGYDIGAPDGQMDTRTANAIKLFQLRSGMKVTGEISAELIAKLRAKAG